MDEFQRFLAASNAALDIKVGNEQVILIPSNFINQYGKFASDVGG